MSNRVVFENDGLIDLRCITTFGISAKGGNPNAIGQFGTGLKYAIAVCLRHGLDITMSIGADVYEFTLLPSEIRGQNFEIVSMVVNGGCQQIQLPFTTDLGKKWELWMAFRELYSNTIDEKGTIYVSSGHVYATTGKTIIQVEGDEFLDILEEKADVFLQSGPDKELRGINVHKGESNNVYGNGIKIAEFEKPLLNRYDITGYVDLTEDRTLKYQHVFDRNLASSVMDSEDEELISSVVLAPKEFHESSLDFSNFSEPSESFLAIIKKLIKKGKDKLNPTVVRLYETVVKEKRSKHEKRSITVDIQVAKDFSNEDITAAIEVALNQLGIEEMEFFV